MVLPCWFGHFYHHHPLFKATDTTCGQPKLKKSNMFIRCRSNYAITFLLLLYVITSIILLLSPDRQSNEGERKHIDTFILQKTPLSSERSGRVKKKVKDITVNDYPKLTAYIEEIDQSSWNIKPLPLRTNTAQASKLKKVIYPSLNSCYNLPSQYPIDSIGENDDVTIDPPTKKDPFLPWIHDVFPSTDGTVLHFVSQNKRRCHTGKRYMETKTHFQPQVSLFQHVPVKRKVINDQTRYVLSSHEDADGDGVETRFICRFKDITHDRTWETLSIFPFNYDYVTYRKAYTSAFTYEGFDNHVIWTSQHLFDCPVPKELHNIIRDGKHFLPINDDYPTLFVDLIPIRTPPRYIKARDFIPPRYEVTPDDGEQFNTTLEFGDDHVIPLIEDSGRLENIPVCKPSLMTYRPDLVEQQKETEKLETKQDDDQQSTNTTVPDNHKLIACTWTANSYKTRKSMKVLDGDRRLHEWLTFHLLTGFDHIYIYDNTHANDKGESLEHITSQFPKDKVTRINWPCKICNNRPLNMDDKGERSSQYAAESSCRLRFGNNAEWLGSIDIDEYLVPLGQYTNVKKLVYNLYHEKDYKIFSFRSWRTRPIMSKLE